MTEREERPLEALDAESIAAKKECQQKIEDLLGRRKQIVRELDLRPDKPQSKTQAKGKGGPKAKAAAKAKPTRAARASKELRQINEDIKRYKTMLRRLEGERGGMRGSGKKKARQSGPAGDQQADSKTGRKRIQKTDSESASDRESTFDKPKVRKKKRRKKKGGQWVVVWQGGAPQ